ncbi:hypothetical protein [Ruminiclostridium hungatei]|nr:hypothetical protein [Ruminiclostridium hungatei]
MEKTGIVRKCDMLNYLIIMDLAKAEDFKAMYSILGVKSRKKVIADILYEDLVNNGTMVMIEDRELYSKIYSFDRHKDCKFNDTFSAGIDEIDFSIMLEKDLWSYIYGEYFLNCRLTTETIGFGLIKV